MWRKSSRLCCYWFVPLFSDGYDVLLVRLQLLHVHPELHHCWHLQPGLAGAQHQAGTQGEEGSGHALHGGSKVACVAAAAGLYKPMCMSSQWCFQNILKMRTVGYHMLWSMLCRTIHATYVTPCGTGCVVQVNQVKGLYVEDSNIFGSGPNGVGLDGVAVQYGHVCRSDMHHADWCMYLKGEAAGNKHTSHCCCSVQKLGPRVCTLDRLYSTRVTSCSNRIALLATAHV
jgi:hypothetical protein